MDLLPHILRDLDMFFCDLPGICQKCSPDKRIPRSGLPPVLSEKNCQNTTVLFLLALRLCRPVQECIDIILYIDPVILPGKSDLTYILRQVPPCFSVIYLLFLILINDFYHILSPLQASG